MRIERDGVLGYGVRAGLAGAAAMSFSTNAEMRLRSRPPSDAPADALKRLLNVELDSQRATQALVSAAHVVMSISLGVAGAAARRRAGAAATASLLLGSSLIPELVVVSALGAAEPPWRWSKPEAAVAVLHHAVYAAATTLVLEHLVSEG